LPKGCVNGKRTAKSKTRFVAVTEENLTPFEIELHNRAWKQAKIELLGSFDANIPLFQYSKIAQRAEEIRKEMKTRVC
jgi:hypothetical protein